jgi:hypothetical protein
MLSNFIERLWNTSNLAHSARKQMVKERLAYEYKIAEYRFFRFTL